MGEVLYLLSSLYLFFFHNRTHLTSHTFVAYFMIRDADGCCSAAFIGAICPLNFTGIVASNFGPFAPCFCECIVYLP